MVFFRSLSFLYFLSLCIYGGGDAATLEHIIPGLYFVSVCVENVGVEQNREIHPSVLSPAGGETGRRQSEEGGRGERQEEKSERGH